MKTSIHTLIKKMVSLLCTSACGLLNENYVEMLIYKFHKKMVLLCVIACDI